MRVSDKCHWNLLSNRGLHNVPSGGHQYGKRPSKRNNKRHGRMEAKSRDESHLSVVGGRCGSVNVVRWGLAFFAGDCPTKFSKIREPAGRFISYWVSKQFPECKHVPVASEQLNQLFFLRHSQLQVLRFSILSIQLIVTLKHSDFIFRKISDIFPC